MGNGERTEPADLGWVARLEELRIARGMSEIADGFERIDSGVMCRGPAGSWVNTACGLGFGERVDGGVAERLIEFYGSRGVEPRVEVAPYADEALVRQLGDAGFVVRVYENILFRMLDPSERAEPVRAGPAGLAIRAIDPSDTGLVREAAVVVARGFSAPGEGPREQDIEVWMRCASHARTVQLGAWLGGRLVGAGSLEVSGEIAALFGLSVLEEFRRLGIQQALIAERVRRAASAGARVATIGARPRVATERNVRRMGFQVGYTKTILVRPGTGLVSVAG